MTHAQVFPLPGPHWVDNEPESEPIYDHEQPAWLGVARWLSGVAVRRGASSRSARGAFRLASSRRAILARVECSSESAGAARSARPPPTSCDRDPYLANLEGLEVGDLGGHQAIPGGCAVDHLQVNAVGHPIWIGAVVSGRNPGPVIMTPVPTRALPARNPAWSWFLA